MVGVSADLAKRLGLHRGFSRNRLQLEIRLARIARLEVSFGGAVQDGFADRQLGQFGAHLVADDVGAGDLGGRLDAEFDRELCRLSGLIDGADSFRELVCAVVQDLAAADFAQRVEERA